MARMLFVGNVYSGDDQYCIYNKMDRILLKKTVEMAVLNRFCMNGGSDEFI